MLGNNFVDFVFKKSSYLFVSVLRGFAVARASAPAFRRRFAAVIAVAFNTFGVFAVFAVFAVFRPGFRRIGNFRQPRVNRSHGSNGKGVIPDAKRFFFGEAAVLIFVAGFVFISVAVVAVTVAVIAGIQRARKHVYNDFIHGVVDIDDVVFSGFDHLVGDFRRIETFHVLLSFAENHKINERLRYVIFEAAPLSVDRGENFGVFLPVFAFFEFFENIFNGVRNFRRRFRNGFVGGESVVYLVYFFVHVFVRNSRFCENLLAVLALENFVEPGVVFSEIVKFGVNKGFRRSLGYARLNFVYLFFHLVVHDAVDDSV